MQNNLSPVYASFPVKAYGKDKQSVVIDITDYFNSDNSVFGYCQNLSRCLWLPAFAPNALLLPAFTPTL